MNHLFERLRKLRKRIDSKQYWREVIPVLIFTEFGVIFGIFFERNRLDRINPSFFGYFVGFFFLFILAAFPIQILADIISSKILKHSHALEADKSRCEKDFESDREARVALDSLSPRFKVVSDIHLHNNGEDYNVDFFVLSQSKFFCITVKNWPGRISGDEQRQCVLLDGTVKPVLNSVKSYARQMKEKIERNTKYQTPWIQPVVVFGSKSDLKIASGSKLNDVVILRLADLKPWLEKEASGTDALFQGENINRPQDVYNFLRYCS
jgi:hypothetical protein